MNYNEIFEEFNSTYIGKEIKKEIIQDNILNSEDKEIIERYTNSFHIMYSIKADMINKITEENFEEIQIIEININDNRAIYDVYGILLSIIPYPILAIFKYKDRISYAVSNRILDETRNNKGKIYTSYLMKEEGISRCLKIEIDSCKTMIDIYNKWISNIENVIAYYERLDSVIETIKIGLHIKSSEVLEKLESYITRDCGTYNMKPKEGWNSKLDKYSDDLSFVKEVEVHSLWEYLSQNTFLKKSLEDFTNWNNFKESCLYSDSTNDLNYSQYNNRMSDNDEIDDIHENKRNKGCSNRNTKIKVEIIKDASMRNIIINNIIKDLIEEFKEKGSITYSELAVILSEKIGKSDKKTLNKVSDALEKNNIEVIDDGIDEDESKVEFNEYQKQLLQNIENNPTILENADDEVKDNSAFMLQAIKINILCTQYASDRLKNNYNFMLQTIKEDGLNIQYASDALRNNEKFILKATEIDNISLVYASDRLKNDMDFMLQVNEIDGRNLSYASDELKSNKEFILSAAEKSIWALAYTTDALKDDKEFVLQIVEKNSWSLKYASDRLKKDEDIVLKAIKNDGWFLVYARNELRNNREFLLKAIKKNKECIAFANDNLKAEILSYIDENNYLKENNNEEYMLKIIKKDYFNIIYASNRLKNNSDFILKAMKSSDVGFKCLAYASDELKSNKDFILKIIKEIGSYTFALASEKLKCNKEFILKLLDFGYFDFSYVSYELRNDRNFMMNAISKNAETIEFASYELRNDEEFVLQAIKINPLCFVYASDRLKNDMDFMLQAIGIDFAVIEHSKDIFRDNKYILIEALKRDAFGLSIEYASDRLKNDMEFMLQVVDINIRALKSLGDKLRNNSDFIIKACEKDNRSLKYASDKLKRNKEFMEEINKRAEKNIILEYKGVCKDNFFNRDESYGLVGCLERKDMKILEKNEFCMKIINRETGKIVEFNHSPLYLVNEILNEDDMVDADWFVAEWKLHLSNTNTEKLKAFDNYMRLIKMPYSIYENSKDGKKIIIENTNESISFQKEKNPLCQYIKQYTDKSEDYSIIQLCEIQPNIMIDLSNVLNLLADNYNIKYRDYIAILPKRPSFGDTWNYCIENNIRYIYLFGINISKIPDNLIKEIEKYLLKSNVEYHIEKKIDDIILTMFPRKIEEVSFIYEFLDSNNIEYNDDSCIYELDNIDSAPTSLWIFETSKVEKEKISKILSEVDYKRLNRLKDLDAPEFIIQNELAPVNCNYGIIVNSNLQGLIENVLKSLKFKYSIVDKDKYTIEN